MSPTNHTRLKLETLDDRLVPALFNLTQFGADAFLDNGAIAHRMDAGWNNLYGAQSHGTGQLRTVLTVDANGTEQGYNTTARPVQFNESSSTSATRALRLDRVPVVTYGGNQYLEFVLNTNQNGGSRNLSVDELRFYVSDRSNLKNYNATTKTLGLNASMVSPVYDLDTGGDNTLLTRSKVNANAVGEVAFLVPASNFAGATPDSFVYIYSKMGVTAGARANGGAEEWGVRNDPPVVPPPPPPPSPASLTGQIYADSDGDGVFGAGDSPLNLQFTLVVTDPNNVDTQVLTNPDGSFSLSNLVPGTYQIMIMDANSYMSLHGIVGTGDGVNDGQDGTNAILSIELSAGENGTGYGFLMGLQGS